MKHRLSWIVLFVGLAVAALGLFLVLNYTSPLSAGPWGILLTFATIYLFTFAVILTILTVIEVLVLRVKPIKATDVAAGRPQIFRRRTLYISIALAFVPLFLISLNSIGQLQLRDVFLILLIESLAIFYIFKRV